MEGADCSLHPQARQVPLPGSPHNIRAHPPESVSPVIGLFIQVCLDEFPPPVRPATSTVPAFPPGSQSETLVSLYRLSLHQQFLAPLLAGLEPDS